MNRSCRGGTPAAGTTRTELFLERGERARVFTGKLYPPTQKKEARKGPGNRLYVRYACKTPFLLPTEIYRKRDDNCDTKGISSSLLIRTTAFISPLASTPVLFSLCKKHYSCFIFVDEKKLGERCNRGMTAS